MRMKILLIPCLLTLCLASCGGDKTPTSEMGAVDSADPDVSLPDVSQLTVITSQTSVIVEEGDLLTMPVFLVQPAGAEPATLNGVEWSLRAQEGFSLQQSSYNFSPSVRSSNSAASELRFSQPVAMRPISETILELEIVASTGETQTTLPITITIEPIVAPDIYLLIGQSNMEGLSEEDAKDASMGGLDEAHPRIWQLNVHGNTRSHYPQDSDFTDEQINVASPRFVLAEDPLHQPSVSAAKNGTRIGLGLSFAKAALGSTTQDIYLVPAAWGGTAFCADAKGQIGWNARPPSNAALRGTLLADRALLRLNIALRETQGIFRGIVWHQGESDAVNADCADTYLENLSLLVARLRTEALVDQRGDVARGAEAAVPFVLGTMSKGSDERGSYVDFRGGKLQVDSVHRNIKSVIPHADFANADDLVPPAYPCGEFSCVHFGAAAYRELGARLHQALQRI